MKEKICKNCGQAVDKNAVICTSCGVKIKKPLLKKWWFWWLLVIAIFVVITTIGLSENTDKTIESPQLKSTLISTVLKHRIARMKIQQPNNRYQKIIL